MPPATPTSGVPSPSKSAMVGGPPPVVRPYKPSGQCVGESPALMSMPLRIVAKPPVAFAS
jgi:hypothetical protein